MLRLVTTYRGITPRTARLTLAPTVSSFVIGHPASHEVTADLDDRLGPRRVGQVAVICAPGEGWRL
jgi:hypothetical protein